MLITMNRIELSAIITPSGRQAVSNRAGFKKTELSKHVKEMSAQNTVRIVYYVTNDYYGYSFERPVNKSLLLQ